MLKSLIGRAKFFFAENPKKAQLITLILILIAIPITVFAALTVQNLIQRAGGGDPVQIVDANGNVISKTSDTQVFLRITLPSDWIASTPVENKVGLVGNAYAQTSCPTIICGTNSGAGGVCSYPNSSNSNVSGCTATCPNGKQVPGFSVSVCQSNNCYFNDCTCYPNPGACDNSTPTPTPTSGICIPTVSLSCDPATCPASGIQRCKTDCNTGPYVYQDLPCTPSGIPTPTPTSTSNPSTGFSCDPYPSCCGSIPLSSCSAKSGFPIPTPSATHTLKNLYIANGDTDGSTGGSDPKNITSDFNNYLNLPLPWKLNPLLEGQNEVSRVVQVTLFDGSTFVPYIATVNLVRSTQQTGTISSVAVSFKCNLTQISQGSVCHGSALAYDSAGFPIFDGITYEWGISSTNSIGSLEKTQGNITGFVAKNVGMGSIWVIARQGISQERKAVGVTVVQNGKLPSLPGTATSGNINDVIDQFGQRGNNLSGDINRDGIVDGIDYNILLRE